MTNVPGSTPAPAAPELSPTSNRVAAVIVTFNRLAKLPKTLETVRAQDHAPEWIVVVNNNSSDGTGEYLDGLSAQGFPGLVVMHLPENIGGAGGFEMGMEKGYELGADHVWVMDDDCYPDTSALRLLIEQREQASRVLEREVPFACSLVKYIDGTLCEMNNPVMSWDWPRAHLLGADALLVIECTFVSVLFPRFTIQEQGLPLRDYFIWFDDKEYTKRLERAYGPGIIVLDSEVVHDMGVNAGVNYRQVTEENLWKFEKGARNQASFRRHYEGRWAYINYARRVVIEMRQGQVSKPVQKRMRKALWSARTFNPKPRFPGQPVA